MMGREGVEAVCGPYSLHIKLPMRLGGSSETSPDRREGVREGVRTRKPD